MTVVISESLRHNVRRSREFVDAMVSSGEDIYGITTGFGPMVNYPGRDSTADQCDNTLNHLLAGHGPDLPPAVARAAVMARLWSLTKGQSGVSESVVDALAAMLATDFAPAIPELGSLGASGDLTPLAYAVQSLRGRGGAYLASQRLSAARALRLAGLTPVELDGRDALALVNGTSLTAAAAGLAVAAAERAQHVAMIVSAVLADLLGCDPVFLSAELLEAFGHPDVCRTGTVMRGLLEGTRPSEQRALQEPYSIRCTPQLIGSVAMSVRHAAEVVGRDLNGVSDNPVFFPETHRVVHGGNFFGQPSAFAADLLSLAVVQLGNLAERQLDLLVDPARNNGLPPMLSPAPGQQHAVQGVQLVATATVAAMRRCATPASIQSLPTNLHNQDVVPFGTQAALNALQLTRHLRYIHGALGLALRQAVHVGGRPSAPQCAAITTKLADAIAPVDQDRPLDLDVQKVADTLERLASTV
jgi:histidine ammonia-lyase